MFIKWRPTWGRLSNAMSNNKKKSKSKTPSGSNTACMEANTSNFERLRVIREGHRRYVSKLDQELTEILQGEDKDYELS